MNFEESLGYLEELLVFGSQLGLRRIERLLQLMDMPQRRYHTVHVTGTNGKGSVSVMLAGILHSSGIHTGLYTSPHLVSYTERMKVDGQNISAEDFAESITAVREQVEQMLAAGEESPTQFEVLTAAAFYYFARKQVEYAVIEVGLGGLLDSTNVIVPEVSVITNVTMEHADRCGGTLEGIAHHKAGIIKEGVPVVTAAKGEALAILQQTAHEKSADIFVAGMDFSSSLVSFDGKKQLLTFHSALLGIANEGYTLHMLGEHQVENSSLAIMAAQLLHNNDERITPESIGKALERASWPGRFEYMELGRQMILIDGAHNPAGMTALRRSLDLFYPAQERVLLLGILKDKDIRTMLDILLRPNDTVLMTAPQSERASDPEVVARSVHAQHVEVQADNGEALERALELADGKRLLVIAGSLYLIGGVRQMLLQKKENLL